MTAPSTARPAALPAAPARLRMTPGRWLTLALGLPVLIVLIGWTAFNFVAQVGKASFSVHDPIPVRDGQVTAQLNGGNLNVFGYGTSGESATLRQAPASSGRGGTAELAGTVTYSLFRPTVRISGSGMTLDCRLSVVGICAMNATLQVPAKTAVSLSTGGGNVRIPGFTAGRLTLRTDGGDLVAGHLAGQLNLGTGGGNMTVGGLDGQGRVLADTGGGDLTIQAMTAPTATITSGGGNVVLVFAKAPDNLVVNSGGGDVTLVLPRANYKLNYNPDGGSVSGAAAVSNDNAGHTKSVTVDSGGGNITFTQG